MPHRISPSRVSHTMPFAVTDRDDFIRHIDEISPADTPIALSEEEVDGEPRVRLWAETGQWPEDLDLADVISPFLPEGEIAVVVDNQIHNGAKSEVNLVAIDNKGESMHADFDTLVADFEDGARTLGLGGGFRTVPLEELLTVEDEVSVEVEDEDELPPIVEEDDE